MGARYRVGWLTFWGAVTVTAVWIGLLSLGASAVIALFVFGAVTSGLTAIVIAQHRTGGTIEASALGRVAASCGAVGGVVATAVFGLAASTPGLAWLLLLVGAATSPWTLDLIRLWRGDPGQPGPLRVPPPTPSEVPRASAAPDELPASCRLLSDLALCRRWRASFFDLQEATTGAERARIVALRADYLAELERRDPSAMRSWLATEPRAAAGPEKFLRDADQGRPEAS